MMILSLDPGGTTGVTVFIRDEKTLMEGWSFFHLGPEPHHLALWDLLWEKPWDVVVCERFMYQRRELDKGVSLRLDSRNYIGIIELAAVAKVVNHEDKQAFKLIMQSAAQAKGLWTDDKLKRLELYRPGLKHSNDATRHLLYYLTVGLKEMKWIHLSRA